MRDNIVNYFVKIPNTLYKVGYVNVINKVILKYTLQVYL